MLLYLLGFLTGFLVLPIFFFLLVFLWAYIIGQQDKKQYSKCNGFSYNDSDILDYHLFKDSWDGGLPPDHFKRK